MMMMKIMIIIIIISSSSSSSSNSNSNNKRNANVVIKQMPDVILRIEFSIKCLIKKWVAIGIS